MSQKSKPNMLPAILIITAVVALVALGGMYAFSTETDTIQGQADVTEYRVSSKVPGRILEYRVKEGDFVHAGDTLALLEAPDVSAKLEQARAAKDAARANSGKPIREPGRNRLPPPMKCGRRPKPAPELPKNHTTASNACTKKVS